MLCLKEGLSEMQWCEHSHVVNGLCQEVLDSNLNPSPVNGSQGVKVRRGEDAASWPRGSLGRSRGKRGESDLKSHLRRSTGPCPDQTLRFWKHSDLLTISEDRSSALRFWKAVRSLRSRCFPFPLQPWLMVQPSPAAGINPSSHKRILAGCDVYRTIGAAGDVGFKASRLSWTSYLADGQDLIDWRLLGSQSRAKWHSGQEK